MKIGIITFHCAHNYGAVLQCYALQEFLKDLGHEVKVMDYRPSYLTKGYRPLRFIASRHIDLMLKAFMVDILKFPIMLRRYRAFSRFIEGRLDLSSRCDAQSFVSDMDVYIFGSDQIWNPWITNGGDNIYMGRLPFEKGNKTYVAYAASLGMDSLAKTDQERFAEQLKNFDSISVRECSFKNMLASLTDKNVELVLDPTLLAPRSVWDKLDDNVKDSGYVLVYQVRKDSAPMAFAKHIARQLNAEVVTLDTFFSWRMGREKKSSASPEEFVAYFKHARCVVTTSFHGTAFSVIFNKTFYCLELGDGCDGRSKSLLHSLHLDERMVDKLDRPVYSDVDYKEANEILSGLRKSSEQFLSESLK